VRRSRARRRNKPTLRLPLTDAQRLADNAARYVRKYLKRGAIAPPDVCDRCELAVQIAPSRPLSRLHFFHPDPAQPRLVAWLCTNCRRYVRATRESLTLTWTWPGITAPRSRKPPNLPRQVAATLAALDAKLPPATAPRLRDAALIATLVRALAPGERERLYAAGSLAGPGWQPTSDPHLNALLRGWAFTERAERGAAARAAGGVSITPLPPEPRRVRDVLPRHRPAHRSIPSWRGPKCKRRSTNSTPPKPRRSRPMPASNGPSGSASAKPPARRPERRATPARG